MNIQVMERQFIQYVIKNYQSLNADLAEPRAQAPSTNDYINSVHQLATNLDHFPETVLVSQGITKKNEQKPLLDGLRTKYPNLNIINDVNDMHKHGALNNASRNNTVTVYSAFEVMEDGTFRFLRNISEVTYLESNEKYDFMNLASSAINSLVDEYGFNKDQMASEPMVNNEEPSNECYLYFHGSKEIVMENTNIRFLKRNPDGTFSPSMPPKGRVGWIEVE